MQARSTRSIVVRPRRQIRRMASGGRGDLSVADRSAETRCQGDGWLPLLFAWGVAWHPDSGAAKSRVKSELVGFEGKRSMRTVRFGCTASALGPHRAQGSSDATLGVAELGTSVDAIPLRVWETISFYVVTTNFWSASLRGCGRRVAPVERGAGCRARLACHARQSGVLDDRRLAKRRNARQPLNVTPPAPALVRALIAVIR